MANSPSPKAVARQDLLHRYLSEIVKYRLLTRDEEIELGIRIQEHADNEAAYLLVTSNLRLVVKIALEFNRNNMQNLLDLIQEGNIGLMKAAKKYDPYKNVKFSYYSSFWIKAYILKYIMDNWRLVKIGSTQDQRKLFFALNKEKQKLIHQGFDPKPELLSKQMGISEQEIINMDQRLNGSDVSLNSPLKDDNASEWIDFITAEPETAEDRMAKKEFELLFISKMSEFKKNMTARELKICDQRILSDSPLSLQTIGDHCDISRERVRQIEKKIIHKMGKYLEKEIPDIYAYAG